MNRLKFKKSFSQKLKQVAKKKSDPRWVTYKITSMRLTYFYLKRFQKKMEQYSLTKHSYMIKIEHLYVNTMSHVNREASFVN